MANCKEITIIIMIIIILFKGAFLGTSRTPYRITEIKNTLKKKQQYK